MANYLEELKNRRTEKYDNFYKYGIEKLPSLWQKCIDAKGDYFDIIKV